MINKEAAADFAGVDEIQGTRFVCVEENQGVVGAGDEKADVQRSEPFGYLFPLSPSGDDDEPINMLLPRVHSFNFARKNK
jgi:hypothetical protein